MLALFRLSRFLLTLISKISLWFLWQVQKSSHDRWFPVSSFEGPELRPAMVKRRLAVRPISMRQLPLLLPLGHKEILVSQVPIIQGRCTKSKLAFYVSNRYDTILILCFCMPIKRDRDKPAWILRLRLLLSAPPPWKANRRLSQQLWLLSWMTGLFRPTNAQSSSALSTLWPARQPASPET